MEPTPSGLGRYGTATLSDALDSLGLPSQALGLAPIDRSMTVAGPAFTVRFEPVGHGDAPPADFIDEVPAGSVVVVDNQGRLDTSVWGGLMTAVAVSRGLGGTVIDGVCRDIAEHVDAAYPVFSRAVHMRTGKDRVQLAAVGQSVALGGVRVAPGDLVLGDHDGVVVVPVGFEHQVRERCVAIEDAEARIRASIARGSSLKDARAEHRYWDLQRRAATDA